MIYTSETLHQIYLQWVRQRGHKAFSVLVHLAISINREFCQSKEYITLNICHLGMEVDVGRVPKCPHLLLKSFVHLGVAVLLLLLLLLLLFTLGWQWPTETVTMPPNMSRYLLPSWSHNHCMLPWWISKGDL